MAEPYAVLYPRSSFIRRIALYFGTDELFIHVTVEKRRTYVYRVLDSTVWNLFVLAPSKGRYFNKVIKKKHRMIRRY